MQFANDIDHAGIAPIRTVLLEGQTHNQHAGTGRVDPLAHHQPHRLVGDIGAHAEE